LAWTIFKTRQTKIAEELILYQRYCKKLAKAGVYKKIGETAKDFSIRVQKQRPDIAEEVEKITAVFLRLRYEQNLAEEDYILLKSQVSKFKA